jgi:outer membrane receptor protein involved in Fe transport
MNPKFYTILMLCVGLTSNLQAQYNIQGTVTDAATGETMIGVTIRSTEGYGTTTDYDGKYTLEVRNSATLTFTYIGYKTIAEKVNFENATVENEVIFDIKMEAATSILDAVVVTTSRYEKNILREAVSLEVISPEFLANNQVTQLDQIISKVPGIQIIDEQASVRGSGFSFGAGSRVSVILDGLPLLGPEGATIPWNYVPIENIAQIEVLKGAASVLYGTSAMNGLINIQTAYPTAESQTTWQTYVGLYSNPEKEYQVWWQDKTQPHIFGTYVSHRTKVNKKLDVVLGGHAHKELSYLQGANEQRYRFNFNTRYRITDKLSIGINGNIMDFSKGYWGFWQDGDSLALKPSSKITMDSYFSRNFDPYITYFDPFDNQHSIKTRLYSVTFLRTGNSPNTTATVNHYEYQFNRQFKNKLNLTAGLSRQALSVSSPIFGLDSLTNLPEFFEGLINGIYTQFEKTAIDDRLTVALGSRWETYAFSGESQVGFPVFRIAGSFAITPKDIIRTSMGQGYRLPSIAEQFIDFNNGFQNFPNTELRPEIGGSYEIGYKRAFDRKEISGYFDAAVFLQDYGDLIQPVFGFYNKDTSATTIGNINNYGFQSQNIADARILGFELGGTIDGKIGDLGYRLWTGYTYTFPVDMATDTTNLSNPGFFLRSALGSIFTLDSSLQESILLYRNLHNYRLDVELYYKNLTVGFAGNYQSRMINVDDILVGEGYWGQVMEFFNSGNDLFPGMKQYRNEHTQGDWVFDLRFNYKISDNLKLNFVINNIFNYEYALRIGKMNPPRLMTLKLEASL